MKNLSPRTQGLIAINAAAVIFGSAALYGKLDVSPFWIVAMRGAFGALTLLPIGLFYKDISLLPRRYWRSVVISSALVGVHWVTFFTSVQWAGVAIATLTFSTFPLFTVLIEAFHQKRKPRLVEIAAAVTIIIAIALLVNPHSGPGSLAGTLIGLVSGLTCAMFWHTSRQLNAELGPRDVQFWQNLGLTVLLLPFLPFVSPAPAVAMDWVWMASVGIVHTALMLQIYLYALKRLSASTCSGFVALEPVYAILFAALFFHEPVTIWVAVSGVLVIGASIALLRLESRQSSP